VQNLFDHEKNLMTFEVLKMVKFLVHHGFYKSQEELKEIALPLILLLNGTIDIYEDDISGGNGNEKAAEEESAAVKKQVEERRKWRYNVTQDNLVIMQCKELVAKILLLISDLEQEMRMVIFLSKFKKEFNRQVNDEEEDDFERESLLKKNSMAPVQGGLLSPTKLGSPSKTGKHKRKNSFNRAGTGLSVADAKTPGSKQGRSGDNSNSNAELLVGDSPVQRP